MDRPVDIARRGLRDLVPAPPWRLATVTEGFGFSVERDVDARDGVDEGVLVAQFQIGSPDPLEAHIQVPRSGAPDPVIVLLTHIDPWSAALQLEVPDDACGRMPHDLDLGPRTSEPIWSAPLTAVTGRVGTPFTFAFSFGRPTIGPPSGHPEDHAQALQLETHLQLVAAAEDLRRQLDSAQIPSLDSLAAAMEEWHHRGGAPTWADRLRARALAYAVRGRLPDALRMVEVSRAGHLRSTVDPTRADDPRRVPFLLDAVARLDNFASWLVASTG